MKKPTRKLGLRTETVRILATMELARVVGGGDAMVYGTGDKMCPATAAPATATPSPKV